MIYLAFRKHMQSEHTSPTGFFKNILEQITTSVTVCLTQPLCLIRCQAPARPACPADSQPPVPRYWFQVPVLGTARGAPQGLSQKPPQRSHFNKNSLVEANTAQLPLAFQLLSQTPFLALVPVLAPPGLPVLAGPGRR